MTSDRDQHGLTREQIAERLAVDDGEPREQTNAQPQTQETQS